MKRRKLEREGIMTSPHGKMKEIRSASTASAAERTLFVDAIRRFQPQAFADQRARPRGSDVHAQKYHRRFLALDSMHRPVQE